MTKNAEITLKERIEKADEQAALLLDDMNRSDVEYEDFCADVRKFTLTKFLLTEKEAQGQDNIFELAEMSVEKMLTLNDKSVLLAVGSQTCTNQSSTDIKKVLLSLALQSGLNVTLTPEQSAECETTKALANALFKKAHEQ